MKRTPDAPVRPARRRWTGGMIFHAFSNEITMTRHGKRPATIAPY